MEEREITERICNLFEETVPILNNIYRGFVGQKINLLKDKTETEQKFLTALPHLQRVALALDSLLDKMEIKVESNILFTDKALDEIKQLMVAVGAEFTDVKDFCFTRNPVLKKQIESDLDKVTKMIDEFDHVHQNRLITGVCMPQASYLYIDMTDSLKRMSRELAAFANTF